MVLRRLLLAGLAATAVGACSVEAHDAPTVAITPGECEVVDPVRLQLQGPVQSQFAGYYAARDLGFYEEFCLDVELIEGSRSMLPQERLVDGSVDFAVASVPKALVSREGGDHLVQIAQIFQRSGAMLLTLTESEIVDPAGFVDQRVAMWGGGDGYPALAAVSAAELDPINDVDMVEQTDDLDEFVFGDYDVAQATIYGEYALLLSRQQAADGDRLLAEDLNVIDLDELGITLLEDGMWADGDRLRSDVLYRDVAVRLLGASMRGWIHCRDNVDQCVDVVLDAGSEEGLAFQRWQLNEVNRLIWPSPDGIGHLDADAWDHTVEVLRSTIDLDGDPVLVDDPSSEASTNAYVKSAWKLLGGLDIGGNAFTALDLDPTTASG